MLATPMPPLPPSHLHPPSDADRTNSRTISHTSCQTGIASTDMSCGVSSNAAGDRTSTIPQRPKLTLQTKSLPMTFGSSTTGLSLSLAAGATASPTVRNTFRNAYDVSSCPPSATVSPSKSSMSRFSKPSSPYPTNANGNPYQQPLGVKSILRNSPLEPTARRRSISVAPNGPNGGSSSRRVFFPAEKRVSYRYPLEEEIKTVHYTARHSDLTGEVEDYPCGDVGSGEDSDASSSLPSSDISTSDDEYQNASQSQRERKKRKPLAAERQIRAVALLDGLETDPYGSSTPQTPRQHGIKRRCEWRWTLGPLEKQNELIQLPQTPEDASSKLLVAKTTPASQASTHDDKDTESLATSDSEDGQPSGCTSQRLSSPTLSVTSSQDEIYGSNTNQALESGPPDTDKSPYS